MAFPEFCWYTVVFYNHDEGNFEAAASLGYTITAEPVDATVTSDCTSSHFTRQRSPFLQPL
jgi:hypothetical protein